MESDGIAKLFVHESELETLSEVIPKNSAKEAV